MSLSTRKRTISTGPSAAYVFGPSRSCGRKGNKSEQGALRLVQYARPALADEVPTPIICEGDVQRLMNRRPYRISTDA